MKAYKYIVLLGFLVTFLAIPVLGYSDDQTDVKEVFDKDLRLFNAKNPEAFTSSSHEEMVLFGILSPFATKGKEELRQLVQQYFADNEHLFFRPVNPSFVVVNQSALAWGAYTITEHPHVGPRVTIHGRYTFTYSKIDGKWSLVAMHLSPLQGF